MSGLSRPKRSAYSSLAKFSMISTAVIFAGCQRIPDQERVTKLSVADIVRNIRCEVQEALAEEYVDGGKLYPEKITRKDGKVVENWIYQATVSYTFEFTSTINNNLDLAFNGIWNIPRRVGRRASERLTSNNAGDFDKKREGINTWEANEKLRTLIKADCSSVNYRRSFRYPIKGRIGVYKVLEDFYNIGSSPFLTTKKYQRLLRFTVLKGGTINPIYFISPVPLDRRTFTIPLTWRADRTDVHSVTLAFVLDPLFQYLVDGVDKKAPDEPKVTLVRIVGGEKKTKDGKVIEVCEMKNGKKGFCTKQFPSEISIVPAVVPPEGTVFFPAAVQGLAPEIRSKSKRKLTYNAGGEPVDEETFRNAKPAPATKPQGDARGLSASERERLERMQNQERSIRADESRIR